MSRKIYPSVVDPDLGDMQRMIKMSGQRERPQEYEGQAVQLRRVDEELEEAPHHGTHKEVGG
jgi:hypothetical protein